MVSANVFPRQLRMFLDVLRTYHLFSVVRVDDIIIRILVQRRQEDGTSKQVALKNARRLRLRDPTIRVT